MCGICGIFNYKKKEPVDKGVLKEMCNTLRHRGPDNEGYYTKNEIGLGHRRLAIIDLVTGNQPFSNEDGSIWAAVNGEIYNFISLREELKKKHTFKSKSDSEVIVHLYEDMGEEFVHKLRGMFSIALWDNKKKRLLLIKDRLGIKPLFYCIDNEKILFGSEIKAILKYPGFSRRMNFEALHNYLSFMTTTGRKSIFEGIENLLPGEILICSASGIKIKKYWDLDQKTEEQKNYIETFRDELGFTVKSHLISDVPLGAFLSGGLDSASLVALMSEVTNQPVKTFSIGFSGDKYYDELPYARIIAEHFKTDHEEFVVKPDGANILPKIIESVDEPFAVSSALPLYIMSKLARNKVKVVLTGDGGDEVMAGYANRYRALIASSYFDKVPILKRIPWQFLSFVLANHRRRIDKFFSNINYKPTERYFRYMAKFNEEKKREIYSENIAKNASSFDSSVDFSQYFENSKTKDFLNRWMYVDMNTSLPSEMFIKSDRMMMAFGLEGRVPFLDHVLVELLFSFPSNIKMKHFVSKYILRETMKGILPAKILKRPKHGFEVPVDDWIRGELKDFVNDHLNESRIKRDDIFNWPAVKKMLDEHLSRKEDWGHQIWILLNFNLWHEMYMS